MAYCWAYDEKHGLGPSQWADKYPDAAGDRQSPVDIETEKTLYSSTLCDPPLQIHNHREKDIKLRNNGHTVKAECSNKSTLTGGPLPSEKVYRLAQFHLHWGGEDEKGSEHSVDGKFYSAEIHFVHWNSTDYNNIEEAVQQTDGLVVLSVLVKVGTPHEAFDIISKHLDSVAYNGDACSLGVPFDPTWLLPGNRELFWTYPGSLTTPPCYESVQFIVFAEPVQFSKEQLTALRSLHSGDRHCPSDQYLMDNVRPTCDLKQRTVLASFRS